MSDENLSIKFTEETKKTLYKNENSFTAEKFLLLAIGVNAALYFITYFYPKIFVSNGEGSFYTLYFLGIIGFFIEHKAIKLSGKFSNRRVENEETNIEPTIMGGYNYISFQEQKWIRWLVSFACAGINVLLYLFFLKFL